MIGELHIRHEEAGGIGMRVGICAEIKHNFLAVIVHDIERERLGLRQPGAVKVRAFVEAEHDVELRRNARTCRGNVAREGGEGRRESDRKRERRGSRAECLRLTLIFGRLTILN